MYRSLLLYSFFLFHVILVGLRHASCMHSRTYIFYLVRGMRRACTAVLASLRLFDSYTQRTICGRHGIPHTSTASRYRDIVAAYITTPSSQLPLVKSNTDSSQCCSPSDHTTRCAALYIAHCSYDPHNATILGDVTAELAYATTYDCVIRAGRKRPKIEIEIAILAKAISVSISNTAFNIESTHSQPASCRATPMKVDDGLEDVRWVHGLGGERLLAASYALLSNT